MRRSIIVVLLFLNYFLFATFFVFAHPGNTDAFGCHTCRTNCPSWGLFYGQYHCHIPKTYVQPYPIYIPVYLPPPAPKFPDTTASWQWTPKNNGAFDLDVTLNDPSPTQYSAVISQYAGGDPGPLTDFYTNHFHYPNISTGKHYLNVKKSINGVWSTVSYWTIEIPQWYPPPTPTFIPTPTTAFLSAGNTLSNSSLLAWLMVLLTVYLIYQINKKYKLLNKLTSPINLSTSKGFKNSLLTWVGSIILFLFFLGINNWDLSKADRVLVILVLLTILVGIIAFCLMCISFLLIVLNLFKKTF